MAQTAQPYQCAHSPAAPTLHFCPLEAAAIGLKEAIVIVRLRFWLSRSKHIFGGRTWVYNTYPEWQQQFPFWSVFTVKNLFRRLEQLGVIESTQRFNTNRWNRRKWYTLNAEALAELVGSGGVGGGRSGGGLDGGYGGPDRGAALHSHRRDRACSYRWGGFCPFSLFRKILRRDPQTRVRERAR